MPRERGLRRVTGVLGCGSALALLLSPGHARAFCRTTTCTESCEKDANGCVTSGTPLAWSTACPGYSLSVEGTAGLTEDQWTTAIVAAFDTWSSVDCGGGHPPSIDLVQLRDVSCNQSGYSSSGPNVNVVYFDDDGWTGSGIDGTLATTSVQFSPSGEILGADIALNSALHDFSAGDASIQTDLISIVTHEVGHFLGLAHTLDTNAVMYPYYQEGTVRRALAPDDVSAICSVYPPAPETGTCDPTPPGGLETNCNVASGCAEVATRGDDATRAADLPWGLFGTAAFFGGASLRRRWRR
jgi:hypothetical protein